MLGEYKQAIECYDNSLEIYPNDAYTWKKKGNCLSRLGVEKAPKIVLIKQKCWNHHHSKTNPSMGIRIFTRVCESNLT